MPHTSHLGHDWAATEKGHTLRDRWPGGIPDEPVWSPNYEKKKTGNDVIPHVR